MYSMYMCMRVRVRVRIYDCQALTVVQNLSMKLAEKETEIEQLREELRAAKALEDQLRKVRRLASLHRELDDAHFRLTASTD